MMKVLHMDERAAKSMIGPDDVRHVLDVVIPDSTDLNKVEIGDVFRAMNARVFPQITFDEARSAMSRLNPVGVMGQNGQPVAIVSQFRLARKWDIDYAVQATGSKGVNPRDLPLNEILVSAIRQSLADCMFRRSPLTQEQHSRHKVDDIMV